PASATEPKRCDRCGWPIVPVGSAGCWEGNCSMRPIPPTSADRAEARRRELQAIAAEVLADERRKWEEAAVRYERHNERLACRLTALGVAAARAIGLHGQNAPGAALAVLVEARAELDADRDPSGPGSGVRDAALRALDQLRAATERDEPARIETARAILETAL